MTDKEIKERALNLEKYYRTLYFDYGDNEFDLFDSTNIRTKIHIEGSRIIKIIGLDNNYYGIVTTDVPTKLEGTDIVYVKHNIFLLKKLDNKDRYKIELSSIYKPASSKKEKTFDQIKYSVEGFAILYKDQYIENIDSGTDYFETRIKLLRRYFTETNK